MKKLHAEKNIADTCIYRTKERTSSLSVYTQKPTVQARVSVNMGIINKKGWVAGRVGWESYSALEQKYRVNL